MINSPKSSLTGFLIVSMVLGKALVIISKLYRESAVQCVRALTQILGSNWAEKSLIPKVIHFQTSSNYLFRMTLVFILQVLFSIM